MDKTAEQIEISKLKQSVQRLEGLVDALCMTNFLVEYQDSDGEVREWARSHVNNQSRRIARRYNASKEHNELWNQRREICDKMSLIEQDHPHLREQQ